MLKFTPLASAIALVCAHAHAHAADAVVSAPSVPASGAVSTPAPTQLQRVEIVGQRLRLDEARSSLSPETGSTIYRFDKADIEKLPLGDATPLNQVLLRAPGVVEIGRASCRGRV